jgi:tetratricopeptide (TPR) repeat protein
MINLEADFYRINVEDIAMKHLYVPFKRFCLMTAFLVLIGLTIKSNALAYDFFYWDHGATGLEAALYGAESAEKPLILYFHIQDCEWCEKLNNSYLDTEIVESFLMEMYKVEVDPDRDEDEAALASQYGITRFPVLLVTVPAFKTEPERVQPYSKDKEMSVEEFLQAIKTRIAHIYSKTAYASFEKKAYEEALKYYRLALEYDQNSVYAYYAMGVVYEKMGEETRDIDRLGEAEMSLLKALEIDPNHLDSQKALEEVRRNMEILRR